MTITPQALHEALQDIASETAQQRIEQLFTDSPDRADRYRCEERGSLLDFSKHLLTRRRAANVAGTRYRSCTARGVQAAHSRTAVNSSERRPALHTLLRGTATDAHAERASAVDTTLSRMATLVGRQSTAASAVVPTTDATLTSSIWVLVAQIWDPA